MTRIEWTDETWNPVVGCSVVSPGCTNCYAMREARRRAANPRTPQYEGTVDIVKGKSVWNGTMRFVPGALEKPLRWRKPRRIFVNSMGDLFHESVPDEWIDKVFAVMALCPQHTFQVLTKRPERMREYLTTDDWAFHVRNECLRVDSELWDRQRGEWPLPNVWLGTSVEDQARAEERIPPLLDTPAAVRFVSCEPLLAQLNLHWIAMRGTNGLDALSGEIEQRETGEIHSTDKIDWVICGGESGPGARPMHPDWARSLRDQCQAAGVPFFFKQWGEWVSEDRCQMTEVRKRGWHTSRFDDGLTVHRVGKKSAGRALDGRTWDEYPVQMTEAR